MGSEMYGVAGLWCEAGRWNNLFASLRDKVDFTHRILFGC